MNKHLSYRLSHKKEISLRNREANQKLKAEVLEHYGKECNYCGITDIRALQVDHINDNGADERRKLGLTTFAGVIFYRWLRKQGWPDGYQILCANCNVIKQYEVHTKRLREAVISSPS